MADRTPRSKKRHFSRVSTPVNPKKCRIFGTPVYLEPSTKLSEKKTENLKVSKSKIQLANAYFKKGKYLNAFRTIIKHSKPAMKALGSVVADVAREEMQNLALVSTNSVWRKLNPHDISNFSWDCIIEEANTTCPVLLSCLSGSLTRKHDMKTLTKGKRNKMSVKPNIGCILGQIAFCNNRNMKFMVELVSVQLWLAGCSREAFARLNHLGLCLSIDATRRCLDRIRKGFDSTVHKWKEALSSMHARRRLFIDDSDEQADLVTGTQMDSDKESSTTDTSLGSTILDTSVEKDFSSLDETMPYIEEDNLAADKQKHFGYTLTFDNVDKKTFARHSSTQSTNIMHNMVQAYAAKDRVPVMHLADTEPLPEDIKQIPIENYLPDKGDLEILKSEYLIIIQRIVCKNVAVFKEMDSIVCWHIPHDYEQQSKKRSDIVTLGVLDKNESKITDMVDILEHYHQYVPTKDGIPVKTILYGDGLSCERVNDAQNARINAADVWDRLEGIEPAAQEWHKRAIILQDSYNILYSGASARDTGTLFHTKNTYMHKRVSKDVSHCFDHATELLRFTTEAYVTAAACKFLGISSPKQTPDNIEDLHRAFEDVCKHVLILAFHPPDTAKTLTAIYEAEDSDSSENENVQYCVCRQSDEDAEMVLCENPLCKRGKWFHLRCLGLSPDQLPDKKWFCSKNCADEFKGLGGKETEGACKDHVFAYSKALMWRGIGEMARSDAIKENDGTRMIIHWKCDMPEFYEMNHTKYFIFAFRLLTAVNGGSSPRLARQVTWNRTVNVSGGVGKNIEMDLHMEHMNRDYKESIKSAGGQLTQQTIERHSQMVGVGRLFDKEFDKNVSCRKTGHRKAGGANRETDLYHLVRALLSNNCVEEVNEARQHTGFPHFILNNDISNPLAFKKRIFKHKKKIVKRMNIVGH